MSLWKFDSSTANHPPFLSHHPLTALPSQRDTIVVASVLYDDLTYRAALGITHFLDICDGCLVDLPLSWRFWAIFSTWTPFILLKPWLCRASKGPCVPQGQKHTCRNEHLFNSETTQYVTVSQEWYCTHAQVCVGGWVFLQVGGTNGTKWWHLKGSLVCMVCVKQDV